MYEEEKRKDQHVFQNKKEKKLTAMPPACSMIIAIGIPSYKRRSFPLGDLASAGYR